MKRKKTIILLSALTTSVLLGAAGITYAGYEASQTIGQDLDSFGYTKQTIFLDASQSLGDGNSWSLDNPVFYAYVWAGNGEKNLYSAALTKNKDGYVYFQIPTYTFTHILFVRGNPNFSGTMRFNTAEETSSEAAGRPIWNQTSDLSLYATSKDTATKSYYDNNLYRITSWGNNGISGGEWVNGYLPG